MMTRPDQCPPCLPISEGTYSCDVDHVLSIHAARIGTHVPAVVCKQCRPKSECAITLLIKKECGIAKVDTGRPNVLPEEDHGK